MRKIICSLALSSLLGVGAAIAAPQDQSSPAPPSAAENPRHRPDPNKQVQFLTKRLKLTADQQNQILPILTDRQKQFENLRNDSSLSSQDRHAKMHSIREESDTKIKAILNDDQKKAYEQMQQNMREHMREHQDQQNPGPGSGATN